MVFPHDQLIHAARINIIFILFVFIIPPDQPIHVARINIIFVLFVFINVAIPVSVIIHMSFYLSCCIAYVSFHISDIKICVVEIMNIFQYKCFTELIYIN